MILSRIAFLVMSGWTWWCVSGEVTDIRYCSQHGRPFTATRTYNLSVILSCSRPCQILHVTKSFSLSAENCLVTNTTESTQTNFQVRNCPAQTCSDWNLATQNTICNVSVHGSFSVVIIHACSPPQDKVTRTATSSQSVISVTSDEPTTSIRSTGDGEFEPSTDYKDGGTSDVVIALSVIICILLIVVTIVIVCICRRRRTAKYRETPMNAAPLTDHRHMSEKTLSGVENAYVPTPLESTRVPVSEGRDKHTSPENPYWEVDLTDEDNRRRKLPNQPCGDYAQLEIHRSGRDADSGYSEVNIEDAQVTVIQLADVDRCTGGREYREDCQGSDDAYLRENSDYDHIKLNHLELDNTANTGVNETEIREHGELTDVLQLDTGRISGAEGQQDSSDNTRSGSSLYCKIGSEREAETVFLNAHDSACSFASAHEVNICGEGETFEEANIPTLSGGQIQHDYFTLETTEMGLQNSGDGCSIAENEETDIHVENIGADGALSEYPSNEYKYQVEEKRLEIVT